MTTYGVTSAGFVAMPYDESLTEIQAAFQAAFGADLDVSVNTPEGQISAIMADREASLWNLGEAVATASGPDGAVGVCLDDICAITGTLRQSQEFSTVPVKLGGTAGTLVPVDTVFSVQNNAAARFDLDAAVTIAPTRLNSNPYTVGQTMSVTVSAIVETWSASAVSGNSASILPSFPAAGGLTAGTSTFGDGGVTWLFLGSGTTPFGFGTATAETAGPVVAAGGTLTTIETPVAGLTSVTNATPTGPADATLGALTETDPLLRIDRETELASSGNGTAAAIAAHIQKLGLSSGVQNVSVFENDTDLVDGEGRPPHSIEAIVAPNSSWVDSPTPPVVAPGKLIASAIWASKPAGIATKGTTTAGYTTVETITDANGNPQVVEFSVTTKTALYALVELEFARNFGTPATLTAQQVAAISAAVQDTLNAYTQGLGVGASLYAGALAAQIVPIYAPGQPTTPISGISGFVNARIYLSTNPITSTSGATALEVDLADLERDAPELDTNNILVAAPWTPATPYTALVVSPYTAGSVVTAFVGGVAQVFICTAASGPSGSTPPVWATSGTVTDGSVSWKWLQAA